jgi:hypothetical protein
MANKHRDVVTKFFDDCDASKVIGVKPYRDACNICQNEIICDNDKQWVVKIKKIGKECREHTCKYMTPDCDIFNDACMSLQEIMKGM